MPCARGNSKSSWWWIGARTASTRQSPILDPRPPPVCFSPTKAPPISAPLVGMLTLMLPQSDPLGPIHCESQFNCSPALIKKQKNISPWRSCQDPWWRYYGRETLLNLIVPTHGLVHVLALEHRDDRSKRLFVNNWGIVSQARDDGRLHKVARSIKSLREVRWEIQNFLPINTQIIWPCRQIPLCLQVWQLARRHSWTAPCLSGYASVRTGHQRPKDHPLSWRFVRILSWVGLAPRRRPFRAKSVSWSWCNDGKPCRRRQRWWPWTPCPDRHPQPLAERCCHQAQGGAFQIDFELQGPPDGQRKMSFTAKCVLKIYHFVSSLGSASEWDQREKNFTHLCFL